MTEYYVPSIEEFYVGFEYEYLTIKGEWIKDIFGSTKPFDTEQMDFDIVRKISNDLPDELRVKYLDKEDIESLGLKVSDKCVRKYVDLFEANYNDRRREDDKVRLIYTYSNKHVLISIGNSKASYPEWKTLFTGTTRNISELKIVLKQIGIIKK